MRAALREPMAEANGSAVSCLTCEVDFDEFGDPQEAQHFASLHNELHAHGQCLGALAVEVDEAADQDQTREAAPAAQSEPVAADTAIDEDGW